MTMDRLSFKRFRTLLVVGSITFPILFTLTLMHQHSIYDLVEGVSNINILAARAQNATTNVLKEGRRNATVQVEEGKDQNVVDKMLGGKQQISSEEQAQTPTNADIGSKNHSFEDEKNDSTLSTVGFASVRLLDGLLVSTFDEGSCISRYQSYLFRKRSPHKPSVYLISKLRKYEHLHRSCGPHTKSYDKIMGKSTKSSKSGAGEKCKYLVWTASNGLGNRMLTLVAAFLYAILTDRVLLVKFGDDMSDLFCEPFADSSWLLPRNFRYWKDQKHIKTHESMLINKGYNAKEIFPSFLILNLQHTHDGHNNFFHCDHCQNLLQRVPVMILWSDQYFVPSLFLIPSFRKDLSKMFPQKDTIFHHLGRYLFHPSNKAWELISKFYQAHLAKANEKIGLQIRVFNTHRASHQTIINEIIACALRHKLLPEIDMEKSTTSLKNHATISKAVLVASLYSEYGERLRNMYMRNTTGTGEVIRVSQPSHEERQKSNDGMHNIKAWSEIYLLSLCDALVTSPKSTFGYVAHGLGGLKPWILKRPYGETVPEPPCQRAMSMEPCFHYPPKYECSVNRTIDFTSLVHHMEHCEDVPNGLRLINDNRKG
ncbi:probable fucosyltransferase 8 isoform X2 [Arachis stenosperma]|uniref:probable fucosyltransferase 8 isoform X2 n=1 Tax=Arachis stenosperma TaxID=217475 RepID=UPI0025AC931B|nr:probable fucosyltransferase 8 isoform X2 [Arachis stenosperma]